MADKIVSPRQIRRRAVAEAADFIRETRSIIQQTAANAAPPTFVVQNQFVQDLENAACNSPSVHFNESGESCDSDSYMDSSVSEVFNLSFSSILTDDEIDQNLTFDSIEENQVDDLMEELRQWVIDSNTSQNYTNILLRILRRYFPHLPKDSRTLLQTKRNCLVEYISGGQYHHFGLEYCIKSILKDNVFLCSLNELSLQINIDGLPLFKSSNDSFWPILGFIKQCKTYPFVIGLWVGKSKPVDSNTYLQKFVSEMKDIQINGILFNNQRYSIKIENFICDAPARSFVKKTKGHNGYYGCDFCVQSGEYISHRMTFPRCDAPPREDLIFQANGYEDHQQGESILRELDLKLISQFPHDYMHLVCLGVVRKFFTLWSSGPLNVRIGNTVIKRMSESILSVKEHIPHEFIRKGRSISEVDRWKATEFRLFLFYTGLVVLKGKLSTAMYNNFMLLFVPLTILCSSKLCAQYCDYAENILKIFVKDYENIYGQEAIIYNIHGLVHIASQCKIFGPLDNFSSFPFENYLQTLKKLIRKPNSPLQQVVRRLGELEHTGKPKCNQNEIEMKKKHRLGPLPNGFKCCEQFEQLHTKQYMLSTKSPDNCFENKSSIFLIKNIVTQENSHKLICTKFNSRSSFFEYPCSSLKIDISFVEDIREDLCVINFQENLRKCVLIPFNNGYVSVPLLHLM